MILSQICNIYDGTHQTPKYVDEGVPFYSVEHVSKDDFSNTKFITEEVFTKECQRVSIEQGDILMTRIGSVGVPKFIDWNVRASFYVSLALLKPKTEGINMGWLSYYIQSPNIQRDIWRLTIHVAFPKKINLGDIGKIRIKLPPKAEQESNYALLKSVDQKINLLTKKKEALETYKKGLMQKIFSQELRFKREDGTDYPEWDYQPLGDLAYITSGKSNREDSDTEALYHFFDRSSDVRRSGIYLFDDDAVIVAGEGQEFIPKKFSGKFDLHQRAYAIMKFDDRLSYEYCYYFIFHHRRYFERMAVGTTVLSLRLPMFQKMMIQLPSMEEQDKIVAVLGNLDSYLKNVSDSIQSTELIKKGLLQQMFV